MTKKILFMSDVHAGHLGGLTHPDWMTSQPAWRKAEEAGWEFYTDFLKKYGPFYQVVCVGDLVDGPGTKDHGRHLISTDMKDQCDMAEMVLREIPLSSKRSEKLPGFVFVRGTEYHTDRFCSFEDFIAEKFGAKIVNHAYHIVDQCVMDIKHKGSTSASSLREVMNNAMKWHELHGFPRPNIIVRGHIHEYQRYETNAGTVVTLPGAQLFSDYGQRNVDRNIDFGFAAVNVEDGAFRGKIDISLAQLGVVGNDCITRG